MLSRSCRIWIWRSRLGPIPVRAVQTTSTVTPLRRRYASIRAKEPLAPNNSEIDLNDTANSSSPCNEPSAPKKVRKTKTKILFADLPRALLDEHGEEVGALGEWEGGLGVIRMRARGEGAAKRGKKDLDVDRETGMF